MKKNINSQLELYKLLKPALRCKKSELNTCGLNMIKEIDIWNYNKDYKWKNETGLTIAKMVDDILNTDNQDYEKYVLNNLYKDGENNEII